MIRVTLGQNTEEGLVVGMDLYSIAGVSGLCNTTLSWGDGATHDISDWWCTAGVYETPVHTYSNGGTYQIELITRDPHSSPFHVCRTRYTVDVSEEPLPPPISGPADTINVSLSAVPDSGTEPLSVSLNGNISSTWGGDVRWTFQCHSGWPYDHDDWHPAGNESIPCNYTSPGTYTARLTGNLPDGANCSGSGCQDSATAVVVVGGGGPAPPPPPTWDLTLSASPNSGAAPLVSDLTAEGTGDATGEIIWRFDCTNDGTFEHEASNFTNPYTYAGGCTYTTVGTYTARVQSEREGVLAEATTTVEVDSNGGLILFQDPNDATPTGWTCISCLTGQPFFQRFPRAAETAGGTGGINNHTHTTTVTPSYGGVSKECREPGHPLTKAANTIGHPHPVNGGLAEAVDPNGLPPYRNLKVIQSDVPAELVISLPQGIIALFEVASEIPLSDWVRYTAQDGRFIRGDNFSEAGGSSSHFHTVKDIWLGNSGTNVFCPDDVPALRTVGNHWHPGVSIDDTDVRSHEPKHSEIVLAEVTAASVPLPQNMIGLFDRTPPADWTSLITAGNERFLEGQPNGNLAAIFGSDTHTHADPSNKNTPSAAGGNWWPVNEPPGSDIARESHYHVLNTSFSNANNSLTGNNPPYKDAILARLAAPPVPPVVPPTADNINVSDTTSCSAGPGASVTWDYTAGDDGDQDAFQVQVDDDNNFDGDGEVPGTDFYDSCVPALGSCELDDNVATYGGQSHISETLNFNTTYYARVRVADIDNDAWSDWSAVASFTTAEHAFPQASFSNEPDEPSKNEPIQFTDQSTCYDTGSGVLRGCDSWFWEFDVIGGGDTDTVQDPMYTYTDDGPFTVQLSATDANGNTCSFSKPLTVLRPIPFFKEIVPK